MSAAGRRVARSYTRARRHPWVLGKIGDWTLPLGPYNPAQLTIAFGGAFLLIKTFSWWSFLGPTPVVAWAAAVWAARRASIGGRAPAYVVAGLLAVALQPAAGRIGGRPVHERRARVLHGGFYLTDVTDAARDDEAVRAAGPGRPKPVRKRRRRARRPVPPAAAPAPTAVQRLLFPPSSSRSTCSSRRS